MTTQPTLIGKYYTITSTVEGTVSTPSGITIASFEPGVQCDFWAPTSSVVISDDDAILTQVFI